MPRQHRATSQPLPERENESPRAMSAPEAAGVSVVMPAGTPPLSAAALVQLQRSHGNGYVRRLLDRRGRLRRDLDEYEEGCLQRAPDEKLTATPALLQRAADGHEHGCGCPECSGGAVQRVRQTATHSAPVAGTPLVQRGIGDFISAIVSYFSPQKSSPPVDLPVIEPPKTKDEVAEPPVIEPPKVEEVVKAPEDPIAADPDAYFAVNSGSVALAPMMKLCTEHNVPFKMRMQIIFKYYRRATADELKPYIEAAPPSDRDAVWKDKALMGLAKVNLSLDTYLGLLPALGVYNAPDSKISEGGGKWVSHLKGDEADRLIQGYLTPLVGALAIAGKKVEGEVSVVDDADWEIAFKRQWPGIDPKAANAFVDVSRPERHIWLHRNRGNSGTMVHEGMHKYANYTLRDELIKKYPGSLPVSQLDEGFTEYFTRQITGPLGITRGNYAKPFEVAEKLVGLVGRDVCVQAYFMGHFDGLKNAYMSAKSKTLLEWENFAKATEESRWSDALSML